MLWATPQVIGSSKVMEVGDCPQAWLVFVASLSPVSLKCTLPRDGSGELLLFPFHCTLLLYAASVTLGLRVLMYKVEGWNVRISARVPCPHFCQYKDNSASISVLLIPLLFLLQGCVFGRSDLATLSQLPHIFES